MFNTYAKAYNSLNLNAVSGTLIKSHPKSKIKNIHHTSQIADYMFDAQKPKVSCEYNAEEIVILQVMLTGGEKRDLLIEYVYLKDYIESEENE